MTNKYIAVEPITGKIIGSTNNFEEARQIASKHKGRTELSNGAYIFNFVEKVEYQKEKKNGTS